MSPADGAPLADGRRSGPLRVGLIGHGAIGGTVARLLREGRVAGCELAGVLTRSADCPDRVNDVTELVSRSDLVVEAAGHYALAIHGPTVTAGGVDLLVLSVGALVDDDLLAVLRDGAGRLLVSTGAIGGLDLLRAATRMGPLDEVSLKTTKAPDRLIEPWMDASLVERLTHARGPVEAFAGSARQAAASFPASANVAATLGLATVGLDETQVRVVGDPAAQRVRHVIRAAGAAGSYEVSIENQPSERNPRTSAITPYAVVQALEDQRSQVVIGL